MKYKFSEKLRNRLIKYFKKEKNIDVAHGQADEWLNSMADLYSCFAEIEEKRSRRA